MRKAVLVRRCQRIVIALAEGNLISRFLRYSRNDCVIWIAFLEWWKNRLGVVAFYATGGGLETMDLCEERPLARCPCVTDLVVRSSHARREKKRRRYGGGGGR
jgi:hypothetical protein